MDGQIEREREGGTHNIRKIVPARLWRRQPSLRRTAFPARWHTCYFISYHIMR